MATDPKIRFIVATRAGGGLRADGVDFPLHVEGAHIADLRRSAEKAASRHFGRRDVRVALLVGAPLHGPLGVE